MKTQVGKAKTMAVQTEPTKAKAVQSATTEAKRTRTKKEDMPFKFTYLNSKNEETNRIPTDVTIVKATFTDGKSYTLSLKDIPPVTKLQLEADAIKRRWSLFLKDLTKSTVGQAAEITNDFVKVLKTNTLYLPKEGGGGPGRVFDFDFWVEVFERTAKAKVDAGNAKVKLMTQKEKDGLRARLESMTPAQRAEKKKEWEAKDPVMRKVVALLRLERETPKAATSEYDPMANL